MSSSLPSPDVVPPNPDRSPPGAVSTLLELQRAGHDRAEVRRGVRLGTIAPTFRGVYRLGEADDDTQHRIWAAHSHLGPESIAVLGSAAFLHGLQGPACGLEVPQLAVPPGLEKHQRPRLEIHFWTIPAEQRCLASGLPATAVHRTLADICRLLPRLQAVACIDSALHQGLIAQADFDEIAALMRRRRHCVTGRLRLAEAHHGAQSPLETRVRLRATDASMPPDRLQVPVHDQRGNLLGVADMGYRLPRGRWLLVEADGRSVHERPEALLHDRRRQNAIMAEGRSQVIRFTWDDTRDVSTIPATLGPALRRAGWQPPRP